MKKLLNTFRVIFIIIFLSNMLFVILYTKKCKDFNDREIMIDYLKKDNFNLETKNVELEYDLWTCNKALSHKDTLIKYLASGELRIINKEGKVVRR